jgi:hypothetical protein
MSEQNEVWKAIPGYEELYEVSNQGRVRSSRTKTNTFKGKVLKQKTVRRGYKQVCLVKDGKKKFVPVHRLVLYAFVGPVPGLECNHKNGNPSDNNLENLEFVTRSQNIRHAYDVLGKITVPPRFYGESHPQSVLTWEKVKKIRNLYASGKTTTRKLGKQFGVSKTTIGHIVFNRAWKE